MLVSATIALIAGLVRSRRGLVLIARSDRGGLLGCSVMANPT
jgi:hypothetical protein